jgi:hypothetical protein
LAAPRLRAPLEKSLFAFLATGVARTCYERRPSLQGIDTMAYVAVDFRVSDTVLARHN